MKLLTRVGLACLLKIFVIAEDVRGTMEGSGFGSGDLESAATSYVFGRNGLGGGLSSGYNYASSGLNGIGGTIGSVGLDSGINGGLGLAGSGGVGQFSGSSSFNFPTKYGIDTIGVGNIGNDISSDYNVGSSYGSYGGIGSGVVGTGGIGGAGLGYGGGVGSLGLGGLSHGNIGYGLSKNGIGLGGLGGGLGIGQTAGLYGGLSGLGGIGYGGINGAGGLSLGQYAPITGSLGGLGLANVGGAASAASFAKGGGGGYQGNQETAVGEEGAKGYKVAEGFDKGEKGNVDQAKHTGGYSSSGGGKKGEAEEEKKYVEAEAAENGLKGEKFSKSDGHKKGHKTSGYHNVYHKDEYKKDTSFYDTDHASGHQESYGAENAHHNAAEGAYEKAEKVDAAHLEGNQGRAGSFTNGHQYGALQGHDREEAAKEHYDNGIGYAKSLGQKGGKDYGQSSGDYVKKFY